MDWITKKMETSENVEIPHCEICNARYSARMTVGRKKVCYGILKEKIEGLKWKGIVDTVFYLVGFLVALLVICSGFVHIFSYVTTLW